MTHQGYFKGIAVVEIYICIGEPPETRMDASCVMDPAESLGVQGLRENCDVSWIYGISVMDLLHDKHGVCLLNEL